MKERERERERENETGLDRLYVFLRMNVRKRQLLQLSPVFSRHIQAEPMPLDAPPFFVPAYLPDLGATSFVQRQEEGELGLGWIVRGSIAAEYGFNCLKGKRNR